MTEPTPETPVTVPDAQAVRNYLGNNANTWTAEQITGALATETVAQARVCRVEPYAADLAEALCRRVQRNLTMRGVALGVVLDENGGTRIGISDPEIRRLEGPHRKRLLG